MKRTSGHTIATRLGWALLLVLLGWLALPAPSRGAVDPTQGPGGPILVVTSSAAPVGTYYAEILRTEGLNAFAVADIASVTPTVLAAYDVVVLAKMPLSSGQVTMFGNWVNGGGNLVAMAPDAGLAPLLGLTSLGSTLTNAYLLVDTSTSPGNGIAGQTLQFHGSADLYTLSGASSIATLYSTATTATSSPAVTLRAVGTGNAAAFTYDLASSIVTTRQGNPAWATQERDGFSPIRSDDKFYGNASGDSKPDWVDPTKVGIPQADEQQRLLANLILAINTSRKPLPRFWYFPNGRKAVVVMTGDDHGNGGTAGRFDQQLALGPSGCSVANWDCVRSTSYIYPGTPLTDTQAAQYTAQGFEISLHINTGCADFTKSSLQTTYDQQIAQLQAQVPSAGAYVTERHHCIVWSDWSSAAEVELAHGIRLDTSYYDWPPSWVNDVPGVFTASAMPMRYTKPDGTLLDVYMAASQMTDESGQSFPFTIDTLLDRAVGPEGYYGAYTVNAHTDTADSPVADAVVASAKARGVALVSSRQLLTWLDARNASSFGSIGFNAGTLAFTIVKDPAANGLQAMLPTRSGARVLGNISVGGTAVSYTTSVVKGVEYAVFAAAPGSYLAAYGADTTAPLVSATTPVSGATGVPIGSVVSATFSEAMTAATVNGTTFELRNPSNASVAATVSYDATTRTARLAPQVALAPSTVYTAILHGGSTDPRIKDAAGNPLAANVTWSFTTGVANPPPACPCSAWSSTTTPMHPQVADPNPVELGVKFRSDLDGVVTGIRFYKGSGNTGTHIGNLWTTGGARLATATFSGESASGWQQVTFSTPVAISANVVYVASYFAPNGNYAGDNGYFTAQGVDNGPIHLLKDGVSGGNGVYQYGSSSAFPSSTYQGSNYWVDVVFSAGSGPPDTTPPTVTGVSPSQGATGVPTTSTVNVVFSEAMDASTVDTTTVQLRDAGDALVASTVAYNAATRTATLTPGSTLAPGATYSARVRGGSADPRVKDVAGNALAADVAWTFTTATAGGGCGSAPNPIVAENCLTGDPASQWDISGIGDASIQGFATDIGVNRGATVSFKVSTTATAYRFDIYRMGWYGGLGARKVATVQPSASLPQTQPACLNDTTTGLIDCGNWAVSGSWTVPANATSGIYFAKVVRADTGGASHIVFIVRDDASHAPLLFQTSDTTWQAYNNWGGNSLYTGSPAGRAYKVSYNRPFNTRIVDNGQDWVFNAEYPMVRWLEANGYDVAYATGMDSERFGSLIKNHRVFMSVGHDEYWSGQQRANVTAARDAGVNLAFFSGNEIFWKTRWEPSIDPSATPYRTLVTYKETHANAKIDPSPEWTGTWRDPRFSPPADGGRPENALSGTFYMVNDGATTSIQVPAADGKMRFWRGTSIASLAAGATATLPNGTLGYEWDVDADNGFRPPGTVRLSSTTVTNAPMLIDYGSTYAPSTANHALTLYRAPSGALVFGAGTVQWSWGLDATHDRAGTTSDVRMQQATVNVLADLSVQPATLQSGLAAATASADTTAPVSTITAPASGATVVAGSTTTISGTASDSGGAVGGVEVSTDGGTTWHPATGRASWTYAWTPGATGTATLRSRAVDDSGNLEAPSPGVGVTIAPPACPCTLWPAATTPAVPSDADSGSVNLGVVFRSDQAGYITGIRFYTGSGNTGTHVGSLWTSSGTRLASVTFSGETASGWQQANFASAVPIAANTLYVASYLAPRGHYSDDVGYFANAARDSAPLHAVQSGAGASNGVYTYAAGTAFPTSTYQATNYWVDVVFATSAPADTTAPTVASTTPANGATNVARNVGPTATFSEAMDPSTINGSTIELRNAANALVAATVTYDPSTWIATVRPSANLAAGTVFTVTVKGGTTDPRVKDNAGNPMAANRSWSFTIR